MVAAIYIKKIKKNELVFWAKKKTEKELQRKCSKVILVCLFGYMIDFGDSISFNDLMF